MKRKIKYIIALMVIMIPEMVIARNVSYVECGNSNGIPAPVPQMISIAYTLLIIGTPLILITFSIIALVKAISGGSQDEIMKARGKLIKKFIAAGMVFVIAALVQFVITKAATDERDKDSIVECMSCFLYNEGCNPSSSGNDVSLPDGSSSTQNRGVVESGNSLNNASSSVTTATTHTNAKNKLTFKIYNQADDKWGATTYPDGVTITARGCMITSVAVVASAYNTSVTPATVFDSNRHDNPSSSISSLTSSAFTCSFGKTDKTSIVDYLKNGKVVVIKVYGTSKKGSNVFTSSQHYMALIDIDGSKVFIGNAYSSSGNGLSGWYDIDIVLTSIQTAEVCTPK